MSQSPHMSLADAITAGINDNSAVHADNANERLRAAIGKVVCVGRNYAAHAEELGNEVPKAPILFMKPASSVVSIRQGVVRPNPALYGETHYEAELCVQLAADLSAATIEEAKQAIGGVTLGLDLTLRELQAELKEKGHPWERAKCFDGACVLGDWLDPQVFGDFKNVYYQLNINNELKQDGDSALMLFPVYELLVNISHAFSLQAGDVIMTGTPSGVGALQAGDQLSLKLGAHEWQAEVK
ncbi:2-keto-4-pentenoate hydratase/2-oxohepta-3-ene-1,7-dioic acid hydratase in catechol pathway [Psychrobacter luti]|uniref:2-keto-4-pentenoate hydratase/2-oxohepta-3-ene-1,7-dioic acid hydratase in catechol pathway n=1 Tax=Psychrobacter luti TaxID=198481 RepID=A0A839TBJ1_9GAMM|nr:fumarylacetoacetate hydrolase family protein [Psychrobacter luti]MBB3106801.1 2-keto-4-pentenoate hydratase/2-oxohepta-3-ene-1,7-dioic acid hydratase in catechol pathway [Psychrobacter luti]